MSLGCRRLSTIVQEQCEVLGEIPDTKTCSDMRALVLERLTLFLHEYTHAKPKVSVAWLSDAENFRVRICKKLFVSKTLIIGEEKTKRTQDASAGAKSDDQGRIELWLSHTAERDMYEYVSALHSLPRVSILIRREKGFDISLSAAIRDSQGQRIPPLHHNPFDRLGSFATKRLQWLAPCTSTCDRHLTSMTFVFQWTRSSSDINKMSRRRWTMREKPTSCNWRHPNRQLA